MENASKALIMAGEILIGVLVISIVVYAYTNLSNLKNTEQKGKEAEELAVFNKEYESYNRKLLRGVDVITVMNKALDNNKKYGNEDYYKITVAFKMANELKYIKGSEGKETSAFFNVKNDYTMDDYKAIINDQEAFTDFKRRIFDCDKVEYGTRSGRINYMHFTERKMSDEGYKQGF